MAQGFVKVRANDGVRFGPFEFDVANRLLYREGVEIWLPPRAIGLLACLLARAGQVVSKQDLLDEVWKDANVTETSLTEAISLLRQTLRDDPQRPTFIQTIPRRGYRFVALEAQDADAAAAAATGRAAGSGAAASRIGTVGVGAAHSGSAAAAATHAASVEAVASETVAVWPAWLSWTLLLVCLGALIIVSITAARQPSLHVRPVVRFALDLPAGLTLDRTVPVALARNGQRLAFAAIRGDGVRQLFVRDLDQLEPAALADTAGAAAPFFSPDGRWVGFFANGKLKKAPVLSSGSAGSTSSTNSTNSAGSALGERVIVLCDAPHAFGGAWTDAGTIVFASSWSGGLQRVSAEGGVPTALTTPDASAGEVRHAWPDLVPDSNAIVYAALPPSGAPEAARIGVVSLTSGEQRTLIEAATFPRFLSSGHLLFARDHAIFATPIDASTFELLGPANPVLDNVRIDAPTGVAHFAVAQAGSLAFTPADDTETADAFRWLDRADTFLLPFASRAMRGFAISPDSTRLAAAVGDDHRTDLWLQDFGSSRTTRLTTTGQNLDPVWSPDGARIVFSGRRDSGGAFNLFAKDLTPTLLPSATRLTDSTHNQFPCSMSSAGIVYVDYPASAGVGTSASGSASADLWLLPSNGGPPRALVNTPNDEISGVFSEDGRWLAYQTFLRGAWTLMLRAATGDAAPVPLGRTDGGRIEWAGSDEVLFTRDDKLMSLKLSRPGDAPQVIAEVRGPSAFAFARPAASSPSREGRVLLMTARPQPSRARVEMVLEWTRELSARVPVRTPPPRPLR
jgi:DNA-binding winged helix-turn-helix (wHTH) protein